MRTIHKYPVSVTDEFVINMPRGAEILSIDLQNDMPYMWVLVDTNNNSKIRKFRVFGTGQLDIPYGVKYIGTFIILCGNFVGHLFEIE